MSVGVSWRISFFFFFPKREIKKKKKKKMLFNYGWIPADGFGSDGLLESQE